MTPAVGFWVPGDQMSTSTLQYSSTAGDPVRECVIGTSPPFFLPVSSARRRTLCCTHTRTLIDRLADHDARLTSAARRASRTSSVMKPDPFPWHSVSGSDNSMVDGRTCGR